GCVSGTGAHDHCTAPDGAPVNGKECFNGPGGYCGHVLGIEARSYPPLAQDKEGLFNCSSTTDVAQVPNCDCEVTPGGADVCGSPRKLWIAYESDTKTCVSELTDFWDCMLNHTNFEKLVDTYGTGYRIVWGGAKQVPASCGTDYACAVSAAGFPVQ